ncbi:hypothetical protein PVAND_014945 [Polypedilum vanderplanki]|uniref:Uncharacterized protein n=1 Tax=Polypedilum vanderplanki TaxID=319348 RepID=A0A9J6BAT7_POLVA|nr:hypothetical protein PVAND_014945 [Polypedilum vanderplanki]
MKLFFVSLAILSVFVHNSHGNYRKCFPATTSGPTQAPTTALPTTAAPTTAPPTAAPTTVVPTVPTPPPTTPAPTQPPVLNQCALWQRYINDDAPSFIGLNAGNSTKTGTPAYVGQGHFGDIWYPARIQLTNTGTTGTFPYTPGVYISTGGETNVKYGEFLVVAQGCNCTWIPAATAINHNGIVKVNSYPLLAFAIGRKTFADGTVAISRVYIDPKSSLYMQQFYGDALGEHSENATDILVCETAQSTTGRPSINFPYEACGVWSSLGMVDSVTTNGLNVGTSIVNDTAYVGRGRDSGGYLQPGRYEPNVGPYMTLTLDNLAVSDTAWLIVPQGCNCRFLPQYIAKGRRGLITTGDDDVNFMVGLHSFDSGQVSIGILYSTTGHQFYMNLNRISYTDEIGPVALVCDNVPPPLNQCATWMRYNNDNAPASIGVNAGNSTRTNTPAYVGQAHSGDIWYPARVQLTNTGTKGTSPWTPGVYAPVGAEINLPWGEFLAVPNGCNCSWMIAATALAHQNIIRLDNQTGFAFAVGRKTFADGTIAISKVYTDPTSGLYLQQYYNDALNAIYSESATELLVCETAQSTTGRPSFNFPTKACGVWSSYGMVDSVTTNGFNAGNSLVNDALWVGRGRDVIGWLVAGRYEPNVGPYITYLGYSQFAWLIVPSGCTCVWMDPTIAKNHVGLLTVSDDEFNFMVGLHNYTTSLTLTCPRYNDLFEYYSSADRKLLLSGTATQVLVCEN